MDQPKNMPPSYQDDEITLKELIGKITEFWLELWDKKWWIIAFSLPFVIYFGYKAKTTVVTYQAALTYSMNDGSSGGGGLSGILGSFGLGKGGKVNLDKIVELSRSRNIIQKVLFTVISLDSAGRKPDYIANHLINLYSLDEEWTSKKKDWKGFRFKTDSIKAFNIDELLALKMIYGQVVEGGKEKIPIFTNGFSEDTGILTMTALTVDEELSIVFCNKVFEELKDYYILSSTKSNKKSFGFVAAKTDSITNLLRSKQYQLARFNDSHRNLSDQTMLVQRKILETEIGKLTLMYGEVTKNYEIADFSLDAGSPDITIIDEPLPPLDAKEKSLLISLIIGGLLGGLIGAGLVIEEKL
ncbi:MAG: hypothetical protein IPO92_14860 [Saprospiraceae bacterium]|nr:hypothetical protein [Saprospiraceae bacterium]